MSTDFALGLNMKNQGLYWKWGIGLLLAAGLAAAFFYLDIQGLLKGALSWIDRLGGWGPVMFIFLYVLVTVLFLPGWILTLGAGVLFGLWKGAVTVSIGSTLGAGCAFLLGRYLARDWIAHKVEQKPQFKAIDQAVGREGWKIVGLTRLSPIFPFNLLNYAFGLTRVRFGDYLLASWIGMMPGTVMYVYIGSLIGDLATLGEGQREKTTGEWILYGIGLLATVLVTVYVTRLARRALQKRVGEPDSKEPLGETPNSI